MAPLVVEDFVKRQQADLKSVRELAKTDPDRARKEAEERLRRAGRVDEHGDLASQYRS